MKTKTALLFMLTTLSSTSFAKIDFPYAKFKEVEFVNPYMTQEFESFISKMHKQDLEIQKELDKSSEIFIKKFQKEKKRTAYKETNEILERLGKVSIKEKKPFNKVSNKYISDEVKIFNDFVKKMQNNPNLTKTEQIAFIKAIKPLHKAYQDVFESYKIDVSNMNTICFVDYKNANLVASECEYMYSTIEGRIKGSKYHISTYMNSFVTKYKVESTGTNYREKLKNRIDEIKRMESFKWE